MGNLVLIVNLFGGQIGRLSKASVFVWPVAGVAAGGG